MSINSENTVIPIGYEIRCHFDIAWAGQCQNTATENGFCQDHKDLKCASCGEQATKECDETMGFVCGFPLCNNCEHTIQSNGCNSRGKQPKGLKSHCKKSEQVYQPWYVKPKEDYENFNQKDIDPVDYENFTPKTHKNT